ncbi:enoyl-CoA hydratase-related protein [Pseudomarimonas arenosa]|uniref:Enoyl-CoA hydratase/isomerase family protein n=1 Tax=Pseudomarimonas arenosa TaxID=2774145 RepID=A0AAW3ZIG8_9GAMM|nr:enoyl-CoA hydratase-related protein [Pseudomarimonas arenosa]MBD8524504.1 enoyl-CoA hydratase/isomerase family protein [Pseudomarimonas arenosa]
MSATSLVIDRHVATLTLSRAAVHNAFDDALIAELIETLHRLDQDDALRALVLTGAGKSFSAGADLGWMQRMAEASEEENRRDSLQLAKLMRTLNNLRMTTIARVNGAAFGGGVGLIACCDIAIGVSSARFGLTETKLGLVPAVISPYVVEAIGARQARRYFQTAEIFDAREAQRIGLLHECVEDERLDVAVEAVLQRLQDAGPIATRTAKRLVMHLQQPDTAVAINIDNHNASLIAALRVSPEGQEGLQAFFDKRKPGWAAQ